MISNRLAKRQAKDLYRFCLVNELLDEARVRKVVRYVIAAGYRQCPLVLAHFMRLVRLDRVRHTANIESAAPLPPDLQASVATRLTKLYGAGLTTAFAERPSLIGGMRIQVGSDVYDGSVLGALTSLEKSL